MTSKDELREKLQKLEVPKIIVVCGDIDDPKTIETTNLTEDVIDAILNLLEGEKQKLLDKVDKEVIGEDYRFNEDAFPTEHEIRTLEKINSVLYNQRIRLATLNKEPNKGEDVDE